MISALMYTMVLMTCFGVLHVLKTLMESSGPASVKYRESQVPESIREEEAGKEWEEQVRLELATDSQAGETQDEVIQQEDYREWKKKPPGMWDSQDPGEPYIPSKLILVTDLHCQSALAEDSGEAFQLFVERRDRKVVQYLPGLLEAFLDEVIKERPSALALSSNIIINGERMSHEESATGPRWAQDAGIQVLVVPGDHDINSHNAAVHYSARREPTPYTDGPEFHKVYREYGYDQALSRDSSPLSYVYVLDDRNWLLMLDFYQYEPDNEVGGRLKDSTMVWANEQLARAKEEGMFVIPTAHHNLLAQSGMYTTRCAIDNSGEAISPLRKCELPFFFGGHLHVQRIRKYKSEPGVPGESYDIQEIVTDALSIPPYQYGEVLWEEDGGISYVIRFVDVSAWARDNGSANPDLLDFENWSCRYMQKLTSDQIRGAVKNLGTDVKHSIATTYAGVYIDYYAGQEVDAKGIESIKGYRFQERDMPGSYLIRELDAMIADLDRDNNYFLFPKEEG